MLTKSMAVVAKIYGETTAFYVPRICPSDPKVNFIAVSITPCYGEARISWFKGIVPANSNEHTFLHHFGVFCDFLKV